VYVRAVDGPTGDIRTADGPTRYVGTVDSRSRPGAAGMSEATDSYPTVPEARLPGGWERRGKTEDRLFRTPALAVTGYTVVYDDRELRRAVEAAGHGDLLASGARGDRLVETGADGGLWRFFFATALSFRPPLAPGVGPASLRPTVARQARRSFADDLETRGFEDVAMERGQRLPLDAGGRARLRKVTASLPVDTDRPPDRIDAEGWLAVWVTDGSFRIAGGAYPAAGLDRLLEPLPAGETPQLDPGAFRDDLLGLLRSVR
jgi:hypothetical protein